MPGSKLNHCGIATAHALARCGFGEKLVNAFNVLSDDAFTEYLIQWRNELRAELRTNSFGYMKCKQAKLANTLPDSFPNLKVLRAYVQPVTSESEALSAAMSPPVPQIRWTQEHSLAAIARFCEEKFEWGTLQIIPQRFRRLLWHGSVIRILRRATLDLESASSKDGRLGLADVLKDSGATAIPCTPTKNHQQVQQVAIGAATGTPSKMIVRCLADASLGSPTRQWDLSGDPETVSTDADKEHPLIANILASTTTHPRTDFLHEYRVQLDPYHLVQLTQSGIEGFRDEPVEAMDVPVEEGVVDMAKCQPKSMDPFSLHRIWVPASLLRPVETELVDRYEAGLETKRKKKTRKAMSHEPEAGGPSSQHLQRAQAESKASHSSVLRALDRMDWNNLFTPASKASVPSDLSSGPPTNEYKDCAMPKSSFATAIPSPSKRPWQQVFAEFQDPKGDCGSSGQSTPKSPRKSKGQLGPSHQKEKTAYAKAI